MKKTPLAKKSKKQKIRDKEWAKIKKDRQAYLREKNGYDICEYCGKAGHVEYDPEDIIWLSNHHRDGNRNNNTPGNAYICDW